MTTRVFGGQTVGQGYFAFKKLFPESTVVKIDTNFIAAGNANEIIDYFIDLNSINFGFTKVTAKQKEKIIAYCNIRFTLKENIKDIVLIKNLDSDFPYGIDEPHNYRKLVEADAKGMVGKMGTDKAIFEIRPIDPGRFLFYEDSFEIAPSWIKVNPDFAEVKFSDPLLVPLIMTDYFIFHPSISIYNLYERLMDAKNGSSLNHKVTIHYDGSDINVGLEISRILIKIKLFSPMDSSCFKHDATLYTDNVLLSMANFSMKRED